MQSFFCKSRVDVRTVESDTSYMVIIIGLLHLHVNPGAILILAKQVKDYGVCSDIAQETLRLSVYYLQFWLLEDDPQDFLTNSVIFCNFMEKHIIYDIQLFYECQLFCTCLQYCWFLSCFIL